MVAWGDPSNGGDSSPVAASASGVSRVFSSASAFAALTDHGSVITWGDAGGDSSSVAGDLQNGVAHIFSNREAFAALTEAGAVVVGVRKTWWQY